MFSDTPAGAQASARLYSLVETAKAQGLAPYADLHPLFKELPAANSAEDYDPRLLWNGDGLTLLADYQGL